jgi:hypothetical protein
MIREIVLHIGSEKTGSTAIQSFLASNRVALLAQGIVVPKCLGRNHYKLPIAAKEQTHSCGEDKHASAEDLKVVLEEEVDRCVSRGATRLILSSELIHSRLNAEDEIANLIKLLPPSQKITVIWYVRRQDRAALSLYSTWLKSGHFGPFLYPDLYNKSLPYRFDYWRAYQLWANIVGVNQLQSFIYDDSEVRNNLIRHFCKVTGIHWGSDFIVPHKENSSMDIDGLYLMSLISEFNHSHKKVPGHLKGLKDFISNRFCDGQKLIPTRDSAMRFYSYFSEVNELLRAACFPKKDALFDNDFSFYPVNPQKSVINHDILIMNLLQYISDIKVE